MLYEKLHEKLHKKLHEILREKFHGVMYFEEINKNNHKYWTYVLKIRDEVLNSSTYKIKSFRYSAKGNKVWKKVLKIKNVM